jgi:predicted unusual protein kinase regulating ubiquinone biosynthesis (AarF/ABC1/UbiB family)
MPVSALNNRRHFTADRARNSYMSINRPVTASRLGRLSLLGKLASGVVGGMVSEGARQLTQGKRPSLGDLLLTPSNAHRLTHRLSEMRGAAMKVGQLLSMDSGQILPPELSEVLARLRDSAHQMPSTQVTAMLQQAWGNHWQSKFKHFEFKPLAAASIGQVHQAVLRDGRQLAIKIQYPGVERSIDSDVDNVASLLRLFKLIPQEMNFLPLLNEAKQQLHAEADYQQEALALERFSSFTLQDQRFLIPLVIESLTTSKVLAMTYMDGQPIENLAEKPARERNAAAAAILELGIREVFDWGFVQTDPNFANYRYEADSGRIQLLDFGATREYSMHQRTALRALLNACIDGNGTEMEKAAAKVGYLDQRDPSGYRSGVIELLRHATEPVRADGVYNFAASDLADRMRDRLVDMRLHSNFWRLPPAGVLFLHRKLGGLYMLLARLRATVPVRDLVDTLGAEPP